VPGAAHHRIQGKVRRHYDSHAEVRWFRVRGLVTRTSPVERQVSEVVRPHAPRTLDWPVVIEAAVQGDAVIDRFWPIAAFALASIRVLGACLALAPFQSGAYLALEPCQSVVNLAVQAPLGNGGLLGGSYVPIQGTSQGTRRGFVSERGGALPLRPRPAPTEIPCKSGSSPIAPTN
jgi:hypothetical protein